MSTGEEETGGTMAKPVFSSGEQTVDDDEIIFALKNWGTAGLQCPCSDDVFQELQVYPESTTMFVNRKPCYLSFINVYMHV